MAFSGDPHSIPYSIPTLWITVMTRLSFTRELICMEVVCVVRSVTCRVQVLRANEWLWSGHPSSAILQVEGVRSRTEWKHHAVSDCAVPELLSVLGLGCLFHTRNSTVTISSTPSFREQTDTLSHTCTFRYSYSWRSTLTPVLTYRPFWKWTIPMNSAHRVLQE